jgi:hypothetical protein
VSEARRKVPISEMREAIADEAWRLRDTQRILVEAGMRTAPDAKQIATAEAFEAAVHVLDLVKADQVILGRLRDAAAHGE